MGAILYLIPSTLGDTNLEQIIPQYNFEIISDIRYFIVENIRSARRFLKKVCKSINIDDINFFELNEHTEKTKIYNFIEPLKLGFDMGIISEAGCPCIADPGAEIVSLAHKNKFRVVPLVGPSSIILSLMASGFTGQSFTFHGYIPAKTKERIQKLKALEQIMYKENQTQIFIEAPYRNEKLFQAMLETLRAETKICVASSITNKNEFICTKEVSAWKKSSMPEINKIPTIFLMYK